MAMKSAYELAMERMQGKIEKFTPEQKEQFAEVDRKYDAKAAQAKLNARQRQSEPGGEGDQQLQDDLAVELASIEEMRERDKQKLRDQFSSEG